MRLRWIKKAIVFAGGRLICYLIGMMTAGVSKWRMPGEIGEIDRSVRVRITGSRQMVATAAACCTHMRHAVAEGR